MPNQLMLNPTVALAVYYKHIYNKDCNAKYEQIIKNFKIVIDCYTFH